MNLDPRLYSIVAAQPYPLLFATISGAHLYGFPSPDSDYDLRGAHVLPMEKWAGLVASDETVKDARIIDGLEMDIVSHDARKFFRMLLKPNGYVLEQLLSPLIVHTTPEHAELCALSPGFLTRHHSHHYLGFAETQWRLFLKETPHRVKPLLYTYRVLLTGLHLMRTGKLEANLVTLQSEYALPFLPDLIARKLAGPEQSSFEGDDIPFHEQEITRLRTELETARDTSALPEASSETARDGLNDLLLRMRRKYCER